MQMHRVDAQPVGVCAGRRGFAGAAQAGVGQAAGLEPETGGEPGFGGACGQSAVAGVAQQRGESRQRGQGRRWADGPAETGQNEVKLHGQWAVKIR